MQTKLIIYMRLRDIQYQLIRFVHASPFFKCHVCGSEGVFSPTFEWRTLSISQVCRSRCIQIILLNSAANLCGSLIGWFGDNGKGFGMATSDHSG